MELPVTGMPRNVSWIISGWLYTIFNCF